MTLEQSHFDRWNIDTLEHRHSGTSTRDTLEHRHTGTSTRWNIDMSLNMTSHKNLVTSRWSGFVWQDGPGFNSHPWQPGKKFIDVGTSTNIDSGTSTDIHAGTSTCINAGTSTNIHDGTSTDSHSGTTTNQFLFALEQCHLNNHTLSAGTSTVRSIRTSTIITFEHRQSCAGTSTLCAGTS